MSDFAEASAGIQQLHARYINAVWRQDATEFSECFTSDAVWKIAGMEMTGRAEIADACNRLLGRCEKIQIVPLPSIIELDGPGRAAGRQHMIEYAKMPDGSGWMTFGIYYDRYAEEDGRWRYARRHWSMHYRGPFDLSAPFVNDVDYGAFPGMPADDEPTYVRPA